ncbi:MAG: fused MFS/spermidine synthase [Verrucomicrobia bacterium]|nr:fused MFS/spermidine synthase [Verrucomicrobiota bacterium]
MKKTTRPLVAPIAPAVSKGLSRYLHLTAAVTGAAIMIVEILGAKMLSPFVGLSHFVWTAQIAVTLVALACGYYVGGRLADRSQNPSGLYWAILAAAGYLVLTVLICEPVAYWCLDFKLAVGSLLASTFLFFIPLALLAMTGPFLIRVVTSSVAAVGSTAGRLTAVGTLGSFAGTVCIGYLMLPLLPNSVSMYLTAAALTLVSAGYFLLFSRRSRAALTTAAVLTVCIAGLASRSHTRHYVDYIERFGGNSHFGDLQVLDRRNDTLRLFSNDSLIQNTYDTGRKQSVSMFTHMLAGLARTYTTNINDVLCVGLGVGIVPMDFARQGARVDVVEINPAVVPVAVKFFDLEPDKLKISIDDGRHFLNGCRKQYDVIVLDAFLGDSSPSHLMTREAFAAMRRVLRPGGTLVINAFCHLEADRDFFASSLSRTLEAVFPGVRMHSDDNQNYFVATDRTEPRFVRPPDLERIHAAIRSRAEVVFARVVSIAPDHGRVMTDDFNPIEFYDAQNREATRRNQVERTRRM